MPIEKTYRLKAEVEAETKAGATKKRTAKAVREGAVLPDGTCDEVVL